MMTREEALVRAAHYCVGVERCRYDVGRKLEQWEIEEHDRQGILAYLEAEHFIDELRYAEAFARDRHRLSGYGLRRIEQELRAKRIPPRYIRQALELLLETENPREKLLALLEKKYRSLPQSLDPHKVYERLMRYALYRGYDYDEAVEVCREILAR